MTGGGPPGRAGDRSPKRSGEEPPTATGDDAPGHAADGPPARGRRRFLRGVGVAGLGALATAAGGTYNPGFTYKPTFPKVGSTVQFDASESGEPEDIDGYDWYIEGSWHDDGVETTATFDRKGEYDVVLEVSYATEGRKSTSDTVVVGNEKPVAQFEYDPTYPDPGEAVTFDGSESYDPDGSIEEAAWTVEGSWVSGGTAMEHTFDEAGRYNVALTVRDDQDRPARAQEWVEVAEGSPTPTATETPSPIDSSTDTPDPAPTEAEADAPTETETTDGGASDERGRRDVDEEDVGSLLTGEDGPLSPLGEVVDGQVAVLLGGVGLLGGVVGGTLTLVGEDEPGGLDTGDRDGDGRPDAGGGRDAGHGHGDGSPADDDSGGVPEGTRAPDSPPEPSDGRPSREDPGDHGHDAGGGHDGADDANATGGER